MRLVENLSHRQRELTPPAFAQYLVDAVRARYGIYNVAALFVRRDSPYRTMHGVQCWGLDENAYSYSGSMPIVAHPPCGPWGRYKAVSRQDRYAGIFCLELADFWGGVVEQPASSQLFRGGDVVAQGDYGHLAQKLTRLYWGQGLAR